MFVLVGKYLLNVYSSGSAWLRYSIRHYDLVLPWYQQFRQPGRVGRLSRTRCVFYCPQEGAETLVVAVSPDSPTVPG
jgi:hypothetical protein